MNYYLISLLIMGTIVSCLIFIALWLVQFGVNVLFKFNKINKRRKENATI